MNKQYLHLRHLFITGAQVTIAGSLLFELLKLGHQIALMGCIGMPTYGLIGTIFSIVFLTIHTTQLGTVSAIAPLLATFTSSKYHVQARLVPYLGCQFLLLLVGSIIALSLGSLLPGFKLLHHALAPSLLVTSILIISEGLRMTLRLIMHAVFWHTPAMSIELSIMALYLALIWVPYLGWGFLPTPTYVLGCYASTSLVALGAFMIMLQRFYRELPSGDGLTPVASWPAIVYTCATTYVLQLTDKIVGSSNLLITLCAGFLGLADAGILKFASYAAEAVNGVMHSVIGLTGSALFANLKTNTLETKRAAFSLVSTKLHQIMGVIIALCVVRATLGIDTYTLPITLFMCMHMISHYILMYQKFYIIEDHAPRFFVFRVLEGASCGALMWLLATSASPLTVVAALLGLRLIGVVILMIDAYRTWGISSCVRRTN